MSPTFCSPGGSTVSSGPDTLNRGNPPRGGTACLVQLAPEPSPPRIVLALEQSQGGHLIPACGGGRWLSPPGPLIGQLS